LAIWRFYFLGRDGNRYTYNRNLDNVRSSDENSSKVIWQIKIFDP
jgi:hypothetical protein